MGCFRCKILFTYNSGKNSWDTNAITRQNEVFSILRCSVDVMPAFKLFQHNQFCLGERVTVEIGSYNNIPKLLRGRE